MKPLLTVLLWLSVSYSCAAQTFSDSSCAGRKMQSTSGAKSTVASIAEDNYDIKYVKLDLKLTNLSSYIDGNVTTRAQVIKDPMSQYVFELYNTLKIDSVKV